MPKFAKGSAEAKEWGRKMKLAREKKGGKCGGDAIDDNILKVGNAFGSPITAGIKAETGVDVPNPFEFGYNLGQNVIAPAMFKVLPPEKVHQFFQDTGAKFRDAGSKIKNFFRTGRGMETAIYNDSMRGDGIHNSMRGGLVFDNPVSQALYASQQRNNPNNIQHGGLFSPNPIPFQVQQYLKSRSQEQGHGLEGEGWMSNLWHTGSAKEPWRTWAEELRVLLSANPDLTSAQIRKAKLDYYKSTKEAKRTRPVADDEDWEELDPHRNSQERSYDEMVQSQRERQAEESRAERNRQYPSAPNGKSAKGLRRNYRVSHKHGGAFTDWEGTVKETQKVHPYNMGGNTNNGVMRVPHAQSLVHMGKGVVDEMSNFDSNYMARVYNSRNLGANGRVSL